MRPLTLAALSNGKNIGRTGQHPLSKMRCRSITSAAKSLDILRQNLQATINKEIDLVIRKYLEVNLNKNIVYKYILAYSKN